MDMDSSPDLTDSPTSLPPGYGVDGPSHVSPPRTPATSTSPPPDRLQQLRSEVLDSDIAASHRRYRGIPYPETPQDAETADTHSPGFVREHTPLSRGSTAYSKVSSQNDLPSLNPHYLEDLKDAKEVSTEELFVCFFSRTLRHESKKYTAKEEKTQYETFRNYVQNKCNQIFNDLTPPDASDASATSLNPDGNAEVDPVNSQHGLKAELGALHEKMPSEKVRTAGAYKLMNDVKTAVDEFRSAKDEKATYGPFGRLANATMQLFHDVHDVEFSGISLSKNTEDPIVFHTNDPRQIRSQHAGSRYGSASPWTQGLKPDLVVLPMSSVRKTFPDSEGLSTQDYIDKKATQPPSGSRFLWQIIFAAVEGKVQDRNDPILTLPCKWKVGALSEEHPSRTAPADAHTQSTPIEGAKSPALKLSAVSEEDDKEVLKRIFANKQRPNSSTSVGNPRKRKESEPDPTNASRTPKRSRSGEDSKVNVGRVALNDTLQVAHYAAARLSSSIVISHAINLYYHGSRLHVMFFDHAGLLCTTGFDMIQDYPFFVILLVLMQKFTLSDWGYHPAIRTAEGKQFQEGKTFKVDLWAHDNQPMTFTAFEAPLDLHLHGRGTLITEAKSHQSDPFGADSSSSHHRHASTEDSSVDRRSDQSGEDWNSAHSSVGLHNHPDPSVKDAKSSTSGDQADVLLKMYRADVTRLVKQPTWYKLMALLHEKGRQWDEPFTSTFEKHLSSPRPLTRHLVILGFPWMVRISDLPGRHLLSTILDCLRCHHQLWVNKICHRDISEGNLMSYAIGEENEMTIHGVLIDFDLAIEQDSKNKHAKERTGTWPFMAIDLLLDPSASSEHRYAYDLESFIWVLTWITRNRDSETTKKNPPVFLEWSDMTRKNAVNAKMALLSAGKITIDAPCKRHESIDLAVISLLEMLRDQRSPSTPAEDTISDMELFSRMHKICLDHLDKKCKKVNWRGKYATALANHESWSSGIQARSLVDDQLWDKLAKATHGLTGAPEGPSTQGDGKPTLMREQ